MKNIDINALQERIMQTLPMLNEQQRRRFLAIDSKSLGVRRHQFHQPHVRASRQTLTEGVKELDDPHVELISATKTDKGLTITCMLDS
jgi:hypothetical protein